MSMTIHTTKRRNGAATLLRPRRAMPSRNDAHRCYTQFTRTQAWCGYDKDVEFSNPFNPTSKMRILFSITCAFALLTNVIGAAEPSITKDATIWATLSADESISQPAIESLRAEGVAGVDRLMKFREAYLAMQRFEPGSPFAKLDLNRLHEVIDAVGKQRYCYVSGIYWHTDIEEAKVEAKRTGKPIVSLHMLGNLTDELSCANSRFFRTTLYSNKEIAAWLKGNCVMHWKSVRPVPKITIDFGDGRKLVRTVTGNSAHYILDTSGQVVDCLPGLYGPAPFLEHLKISAAQASVVSRISDQNEKRNSLLAYHRNRLETLTKNWRADMKKLGFKEPTMFKVQYTAETLARLKRASEGKIQPQAASSLETELVPVAVRASAIAQPKNEVEAPLLAAIDSRMKSFVETADETIWQQLAELHAADATLDETSTAVITSENPTATAAGALARTKRLVESPLVKMLRNLRGSIALDTVRNEYELHRQIHEWFLAEPSQDLTALNRRVYAELFLTPDSDPWLGLAPGDAYSAIRENGYIQPANKN